MATYVFPRPYVPKSVHNPYKATVWLKEIDGTHDCRFSFYTHSLATALIHCRHLPLVLTGAYEVARIRVVKQWTPLFIADEWKNDKLCISLSA